VYINWCLYIQEIRGEPAVMVKEIWIKEKFGEDYAQDGLF
jgi:hypothetical protein